MPPSPWLTQLWLKPDLDGAPVEPLSICAATGGHGNPLTPRAIGERLDTRRSPATESLPFLACTPPRPFGLGDRQAPAGPSDLAASDIRLISNSGLLSQLWLQKH